MLTLDGLLVWTILIGCASLLSFMQAWALSPGASRSGRYLVAWAVSSLGLVVLSSVLLGSPRTVRREIRAILVLAGITAAVSLGVGAWFGHKLKAAQTTVGQRAFALFWPHMVMIAVLGGLAMFYLYAAALSRIH
jgi:hypothetical protein